MGDGDKDDKDGGMGTSGEIRRKELEKAAEQAKQLERLREAARQREEEERRRKGN